MTASLSTDHTTEGVFNGGKGGGDRGQGGGREEGKGDREVEGRTEKETWSAGRDGRREIQGEQEGEETVWVGGVSSFLWTSSTIKFC